MKIFSILQNGKIYSDRWPLKTKLGAIFPENRVIKCTKFAEKVMPLFAVFTIMWYYFTPLNSMFNLMLTIATACFAISIPLQGLYWLGKRAHSLLSLSTLTWFITIRNKLIQAEIAVPETAANPTYLDLANILQLSYKKLDSSFWEDI